MADESIVPTSVASPKADAPEATVSVSQADDGDAGGENVNAAATPDAPADTEVSGAKETPAIPERTTDQAMDTANDGAADNAGGLVAATPKSSSKNKKRKSSSGVPEHKAKKLNKKKSMPNLHLDVEPGQYWWARMKGHPPWPAIVCDEAMLPESLLGKRPVSAWRPDGSYREDFRDNGKNARDRRYPVMFLGTNEFVWIVNTELENMDLDDIKSAVESDERGKKTKALWDAYQIAAEEHDLDYFKNMLIEHERARISEAQERAEREAKKSAKKDKSKRKSGGDEDIEMEEADGDDSKSKKASKKRKKDVESEGEGIRPKTPKTKLKVNGPKTPAETSAAKLKKTPATKKSKGEQEVEAEPAKPSAPPRFADEGQNLRFKTLYFLRSRLQRGFLGGTPKSEEVERLNDCMSEVEQHPDVEGEIIRESRIHRVLKNIIKLDFIPREEEFNFKKRSNAMLAKWSKALGGDAEAPGVASAAAGKPKAVTNGVEHAESSEKAAAADADAAPLSAVPDSKIEEGDDAPVKDDTPEETAVPDQKEQPAEAERSDDADVSMEDVKPTEIAQAEVSTTA